MADRAGNFLDVVVSAHAQASGGHDRWLPGALWAFETVYPAPVVTTPFPVPGSITRTQIITFTVTSLTPIRRFVVLFEHSNGLSEVAYDGTVRAPYSSGSLVVPNGTLTSYSVQFARTNGWPSASFDMRVFAVHEGGIENTTTTYSYTVSNPDLTAPAFDQFSPAKGGYLNEAGAATFRALDSGGSTAQLTGYPVVTYVKPDGSTEVVYDGTAFQGAFAAGSTRGGTSNGSFSVVRAGGWVKPAVVLELYAVDPSGNVARDHYQFNVDNQVPVLDNFSPSSGSSVPKQQTVSFDLTDDDAIAQCVVLAEFDDGVVELVHDGAAFAPPYDAASERTDITDGYHYLISRGQWRASFTLRVMVVDEFGVSLDDASYSLTVTDPPPGDDTTAPEVSNVVPAPGTTVAKNQPVTFDVTDGSGFFRRIFVTATFPSGVTEVVHDGASFKGYYGATSTRTAITNGFHFVVLRAGGWPESPTVTVYPIDASGNEGV